MKDTSLVALYRCKTCHARMFQHDIAGHASRHGLTAPWPRHFSKGEPDTSPFPGALDQPLNPKHRNG